MVLFAAGPKNECAGLVEDLEGQIADGHDVVWTNRAVRVRRDSAGAGLAIKGNYRPWDFRARSIRSAHGRLKHRIKLRRKTELEREGCRVLRLQALVAGLAWSGRHARAVGGEMSKLHHRRQAAIDAFDDWGF